jgi:hypothetical protein
MDFISILSIFVMASLAGYNAIRLTQGGKGVSEEMA